MKSELFTTVAAIRAKKLADKQKAARERWAKRVDAHKAAKELINGSR